MACARRCCISSSWTITCPARRSRQRSYQGQGTLTAETEGSASAARFRQEHHLGVQPLGDLVAVIEQATGIDVAVLDAGPDEHGLTMRDPVRGTIFIGVARTRNPMRQRSTLAHELGHGLFEDWTEGSP